VRWWVHRKPSQAGVTVSSPEEQIQFEEALKESS
jgi:hypothetical protein